MAGPLVATYRLQLDGEFGFGAAADLTPYLAALGVSHVYLSPCLQARSGSAHGYDVTDPTRLDEARGGERGFAALAAAAREHGLELVLDIVPNHMAASVENPWWRDLLAHGEASPFRAFFDVAAGEPVVLPVLDAPLAELIAAGEVRVERRAGGACLAVRGLELPLAPASSLDSTAGTVELEPLLEAQAYRLVPWQDAGASINYRRFFDIADLVGVRVEDERVFAATHERILGLVRDGTVAALRVDHVDGLRDPAGYLDRLRDAAHGARIWVEKILHPDEVLPAGWPVAGTTGYEFLRLVDGVLLDASGEIELTRLAGERTGEARPFAAIARQARAEVLEGAFAADFARLVARFTALARRERRAIGEDAARRALAAVLAVFPVYRTYARAGEAPSHAEQAFVDAAVQAAREQQADLDATALALLHATLVGAPGTAEAVEFVERFQQLTSALAAKGIEDTAFYRYHRLVALDEVGGDPGRFGVPVEQFHRAMARVQRDQPETLLALSTHDSKRSADVRARLLVLAELPQRWREVATAWAQRQAGLFPDPGMQYLACQTLVGAWPIEAERVRAVLQKSAREAKQHTSWQAPDERYERALARAVDAMFADREFVAEVAAFVRELLPSARTNALAATLLHLTAPGVPDLYQGSELEQLRLVDPDNRQPVDYARRRQLLASLPRAGPLPDPGDWFDAAKLGLIQRALEVRREHAHAFGAVSTYEPLAARGPAAAHVLAFARRSEVVAVVPRWTARLAGRWQGTRLSLPPGRWRNVCDASEHDADVEVEGLLAAFPVALLVRVDP